MGYKKWACFDFDGVIAKYDKWRGFDVLGEPKNEVISAINKLKDSGWKITIFTTRLDTPVLRNWLKDNNVKFDSINSNAHNPPSSSQKPIYHVIVDDRAIGYKEQSCCELIHQIENLVKSMEDLKND